MRNTYARMLFMDFRRQQREHSPYSHRRDGSGEDSVGKKAQQRLFDLRRLKTFGLAPKTLTNFYRCTIESILSDCITALYDNSTAATTGLSRGWYGLPSSDFSI
jgi:hypothetical protein